MIVYQAMHGSHGRGEAKETSDKDYFFVIKPTKEELFEAAIGVRDISKTVHRQTDKADIVEMYLPKFVHQLAKGNFNCVDALHSKVLICVTPVSTFLKSIDWCSEQLKTSLMGYTLSYLSKKNPTEKDYIQASLRVQQAYYLGQGYEVSYPLCSPDQIRHFYELAKFQPKLVKFYDVKAIIRTALEIPL